MKTVGFIGLKDFHESKRITMFESLYKPACWPFFYSFLCMEVTTAPSLCSSSCKACTQFVSITVNLQQKQTQAGRLLPFWRRNLSILIHRQHKIRMNIQDYNFTYKKKAIFFLQFKKKKITSPLLFICISFNVVIILEGILCIV